MNILYLGYMFLVISSSKPAAPHLKVRQYFCFVVILFGSSNPKCLALVPDDSFDYSLIVDFFLANNTRLGPPWPFPCLLKMKEQCQNHMTGTSVSSQFMCYIVTPWRLMLLIASYARFCISVTWISNFERNTIRNIFIN